MNKKKKLAEAFHLTKKEKAVEDELEDMLRSTGYLFPITPQQVDAYQKLSLEEDALLKEKDSIKGSKKKKKEDQ